MADDVIGKATNIAELALIGGIVYLGYKLYKEFWPKKDETPSGDQRNATNQDTPGQTVVNLFGVSGSTGDMQRTRDNGLPPSVNFPVNMGTYFRELMAKNPGGAKVVTNNVRQSWYTGQPWVRPLMTVADIVSGQKPTPSQKAISTGVALGLGRTSPLINSLNNILGIGKTQPQQVLTEQKKVIPKVPASWTKQPLRTATAAEKTVIYNSDRGVRIPISKVNPADAREIPGQESREVFARQYGATAVYPTPIKPITDKSEVWYTRVFNGGVQVWDNAQGQPPAGQGWQPTSKEEAIRRLGGR